ncbi:MAG: hypothetical protein KDI38_03645 [Calditrichaeota bacterium]|nr:hypothetical protein [Calditrichota bacterium]
MPENTVTVSKDEFTQFREAVMDEIRKLGKKLDFVLDPKTGLYLSVNDNSHRISVLEKKQDEQDRKIAEQAALITSLQNKDHEFDNFKTKIVTAVAVVQVLFGVAITLLVTFLKG